MTKEKKLGVFLIVCGACTVIGAFAMHFHAEMTVVDTLTDRVVYEKENEVEPESEAQSTLVSMPEFTPVEEDMVVDPITSFKNVIDIPSCGIQVPITPDISKSSLRRGAGHFPETANVGEIGNACFAGHYSTIYNCIFNNLPNIKLYDQVIGYNDKGEKTVYYVIGKYVTTPDNVGVLNQTEDTKDLTIVTCSENGTMRLIVQCRVLTEQELEVFKRESEKEKRESMYKVADEIGTVRVINYIKTRGMAENMSYTLPARRHHDYKTVMESLFPSSKQ